jgi:predicted RNA-binding Zn ribbon-like protein
METKKTSLDDHVLEMESVCLDFANTVDWHASDHPKETLNTYADLVCWADRVGVVEDGEARHLLREGARRPADADAVLKEALALRETIYRVFSALAAGRLPEPGDLTTVNAAIPRALGRLHIIRTTDGFDWEWNGRWGDLDRMLWPVVRSTGDLLTSDKLDRVGQCADDRGCGWLFLDMSRNRSRRWCDMRDCGNRAKARRHYRRKSRTDGASTCSM